MANVALATSGGTASASSTFTVSGSYLPEYTIDGRRRNLTWGDLGGGWSSYPADTAAEWLRVDFSGSKTIDTVVVVSLQDAYTSPVEPDESLTFSLYGITDFLVQTWNGSSWDTRATITGNNKVVRTATFSPVTTSAIRVYITGYQANYARLVEVEAWEVTGGATPIAAISAGYHLRSINR